MRQRCCWRLCKWRIEWGRKVEKEMIEGKLSLLKMAQFHFILALSCRASSTSLLLVLLFSVCMRTFGIFHIGLKFNELVFISLPHIHEWMNFYFLKSIFLSMLTLDSQKGQIFHTQELFFPFSQIFFPNSSFFLCVYFDK